MTRRTFYNKLRAVASQYRWRITKEGKIRATKHNHSYCPLTAAFNKRDQMSCADLVAGEKGMGIKDAYMIMEASDFPFEDTNVYYLPTENIKQLRPIRRTLKKIVGLA